MSTHLLCGLVALAGFAAVALRALCRALPPEDVREGALLVAVVVALVLSAAWADEIDAALPWSSVAGEP